jgi:uncharacterized delta-60 repeat protein
MGKINFHIRNFESPYQTPGAGSYWDFFDNFYKNSIYNKTEEIFILYPLVIEKDISETNLRHNFIGPLDKSKKMYDFRVSKGEYSSEYPLDLKIGDINITTPETISLKYSIRPSSDLQNGRIFSVIFENNAWQNWGIFNESVRGIFLDKLGRLFASTRGGLSYSSDFNNFFNINKNKGFGSNLVNDVLVTDLGIIYVATDFGLAISVDNGETFQNKFTNDGLGSNKVNKIFYDVLSGKLYVATSSGLSISIDNGISFVNKTTNSGLGSNYVNSVFVDSSGTLYAATENGLSISYDYGESFSNKVLLENFSTEYNSNIISGFNNIVTSIQSIEDKLLFTGNFTEYKGIPSSGVAKINPDGSLDSSFNIGNGFNASAITSTVQFDGKILIAGNFTQYKSTSINRVARLNPDGSLDSSFNIGNGFNNTVSSIKLQSDNKIIVVGNFTEYNNNPINRIARLNPDGSLDSSFNIGNGFNEPVSSIAIQSDNKLLITGNFTSYNNNSSNRIARLNSNGSLDTSFNIGIGFDDSVFSSLIQTDGKIVVVGNFTEYKGSQVSKIARINQDGSIDSIFNIGSGFNNTALSVAQQMNGKLIVSGNFTNYRGIPVTKLARINSDGSLDFNFNIISAFNENSQSIVQQLNDKLILSSSFLDQGVLKIINLATVAIGAGFNGYVTSILPQKNNTLLVGGEFTLYNEIPSNRIVRLNLADGSLDSNFNVGSGFDGTVSSIISETEDQLIVTGNFNKFNGFSIDGAVRINYSGAVSPNLCKDVFVSATGIVAVATDNGVAISTDGCVTFFLKTKLEGLPSNFIRTVYFDSLNKLYIGTLDGLLISDNLLDNFELLNISNGLLNNSINDVLKDESNGDLIVSTEQGISIVKQNQTVLNRTTNNGLGSFFKNTVIDFLGRSILNSRYLSDKDVQPMSNYEDFCLHFYVGFKGKFSPNQFGNYLESYVIFYPGNDSNSDEVISYNF